MASSSPVPVDNDAENVQNVGAGKPSSPPPNDDGERAVRPRNFFMRRHFSQQSIHNDDYDCNDDDDDNDDTLFNDNTSDAAIKNSMENKNYARQLRSSANAAAAPGVEGGSDFIITSTEQSRRNFVPSHKQSAAVTGTTSMDLSRQHRDSVSNNSPTSAATVAAAAVRRAKYSNNRTMTTCTVPLGSGISASDINEFIRMQGGNRRRVSGGVAQSFWFGSGENWQCYDDDDVDDVRCKNTVIMAVDTGASAFTQVS